MIHFRIGRGRIGALLAVLVTITEATSAAPLTFTSVVRLQTPPGATDIRVLSYDSVCGASGVVGNYYDDSIGSGGAVRWSLDGSVTVLTDPPAGSSQAFGINASAQSVGYAYYSFATSRAVRWSPDGSPTLLANAPAQSPSGSRAYAINNSGQVVGYAGQGSEAQGYYPSAVRWASDGSVTLLGQVPGLPPDSKAYNINEAGQAAGYVGATRRYAMRWSADGSPTVLGQVPGTFSSEAYDINEAGQAVGYADLGPHPYAARWEADGSGRLLGDLPGVQTGSSYAFAVTDGGLTSGIIAMPNSPSNIAVIWDSAGIPTRVQDMIIGGDSWTFELAMGIDVDGGTLRVAAYGYKTGEPFRWYLLSAPLPEPAAATSFALAAAVSLARRSRRNRIRSSLRTR